MQFLATTTPGLERVAADEVAALVDADPERRYRGAIAFEAGPGAARRLNRRARTLNRVLVELVDREFDDLEHLRDLTAALPVDRYLAPGQTFGVRPTRHGDHDFTSVDVGDRVGQGVVDGYRAATGDRPPVDLDDPDVIVRAFVRNDTFLLGIDATGARSLHRRPYRECEHDAPLRPTLAAALLRLAGFGPGAGDDRSPVDGGDRADRSDRPDLLDPTCGSGTVPIEAGLAALGRSPNPDRSFAAERLSFLPEADDGTGNGDESGGRSDDDSRDRSGDGTGDDAGPGETAPSALDLRGTDVEERWVDCARTNVRAAGLSAAVTVERGDATERPVDADAVVANLPYGIRTPGDPSALHHGLSARLREGDWRVAVLFTVRPELLDIPVERTIDVRYGRLEATVVVARR